MIRVEGLQRIGTYGSSAMDRAQSEICSKCASRSDMTDMYGLVYQACLLTRGALVAAAVASPVNTPLM
jgi:hypothetical protein